MTDVPAHVTSRRKLRRKWAAISFWYIILGGLLLLGYGLLSDDNATRVRDLLGIAALSFAPATTIVMGYLAIGAYENAVVIKNGGS